VRGGRGLNGAVGYYLYSLSGELKKKTDEDAKLQNEIAALFNIVKDQPMKPRIGKEARRFVRRKASSRNGQVQGTDQRCLTTGGNNSCVLLSVTPQEGVPDSTKNYVKDIWKTRWKADFFNWCKLMNEMEERFPRFVAFENMSFAIPNSGMIPTGAATRNHRRCDYLQVQREEAGRDDGSVDAWLSMQVER